MDVAQKQRRAARMPEPDYEPHFAHLVNQQPLVLLLYRAHL